MNKNTQKKINDELTKYINEVKNEIERLQIELKEKDVEITNYLNIVCNKTDYNKIYPLSKLILTRNHIRESIYKRIESIRYYQSRLIFY